jgi:hypothetical protein
MDFDKAQLELHIIDARRNADTVMLSRYIMRYLCTFDDNVVFAPQGLANTLQSLVGLSKRTTHRIIDSLTDRNIFTKEDEFSLQLNPQFSSKTSNSIKYAGDKIVFSNDESLYLFELASIRAEIWALRGKNKRRTKKDDDMKQLIKKVGKLEEQNAEMMQLLRNIAKGMNSDEAKEKAECHLRLIEGGKE